MESPQVELWTTYKGMYSSKFEYRTPNMVPVVIIRSVAVTTFGPLQYGGGVHALTNVGRESTASKESEVIDP